MNNVIAIKKLKSVVVENSPHVSAPVETSVLLQFNAEMMRLGFVMSDKLFESLKNVTKQKLVETYNEVIAALISLKGDDVEYNLMYPNFPNQIMAMDTVELYINALVHYWSYGQWLPKFEKLAREIGFEDTKLAEIGVCSFDDLLGVATSLLSSNSSLSEEDKMFLRHFMDNYDSQITYPEVIPFKETLCIVAAKRLSNDKPIEDLITNATDALRVMTHLSGGDVSLAANTKFKSLPKRHRRMLLSSLEKVASMEDLLRHRNKWVRAFHNLHVGEYAKAYPKVAEMAALLRSGKVSGLTFNSKVEQVLSSKNVDEAGLLLSKRPGDFARRLDHLLRLSDSKQHKQVVGQFAGVADKVSTRVVCQLLGHFAARDKAVDKRVVFPKGQMTKAVLVKDKLPSLPKGTVSSLRGVCQKTMVNRFSKLDSLGKVWIDPALVECPIPMQQRSASTGLFQVARGTRLPMSDKGTLRFFIYWKGRDIDLSATLHDENLDLSAQISYTNLRNLGINACHSGDIVDAPNGAAEFIDIDIEQALKAGNRYIVMSVFVFNGPNFAQHEDCYAGWMMRDQPDKNEVFDPKFVEQKIDLRSESRNAIPIVFDLKERKGIWCDLVTRRMSWYYGNNLHSNLATIKDVLKSMLFLDNKPNLYMLFESHAHARGTLVNNKEEADTVFSLTEGVTPFDVTKISSEYLV